MFLLENNIIIDNLLIEKLYTVKKNKLLIKFI